MKADDASLVKELRRTPAIRQMLSSAAAASPEAAEALTKAFSSLDAYAKLESGIDSYMYLLMDNALAASGGKEFAYVREILKREIDAKNIMIIERLKKHNTARERIKSSLIKGGTLTPQIIDRIIDSKDMAGLMHAAKSKFRGLELKEVKDLSQLEI